VSIAALGDGWFGNDNARARLRRDGESVVVEALDAEDVAAGEVLLDELAGAVTSVSQILDEQGSVLREVAVAPVDGPAPITLARLEEAVRAAWSADTSDDPENWTEENPSFQHCDVTARVVHEYLGGDILVCGVVRDGMRVDRHAWNRLSSGIEIDLTREQFLDGETFEAPVVLEHFVGAKVDARYAVFAARVRERLSPSRR
jgi:hypothetical protein